MIVLGTIPAETILSLGAIGAARIFVLDDGGEFFRVKVIKSLRIKVFLKSLECSSCERVGAFFRLEKHIKTDNPHLNLYSDDGTLMTKDHIVPKSKGGKNHMSNLQTMCSPCNGKDHANLKPGVPP